jgi:hypothetical protein
VFRLAGGHAWRALTEGSYTHFVISGITRLERRSRELRLANSRDGELRQAPLGIGLGHSTVVTWELWSLRLVLFTHGNFHKDPIKDPYGSSHSIRIQSTIVSIVISMHISKTHIRSYT